MNLSKEDLTWAAKEGAISAEQADLLWLKLQERGATSTRSKFDAANIAYYFGALIVMSAMGWLMTLGWEQFGGLGIFLLSTCYAFLFVLAGRTLWYKENLTIPGGLLFTLAVWMTPLAIYGLERAAGVWPQGAPDSFQSYHIWIKGSWILMEVGTIISGLIALKFIRFPFLTFPIAFSLWYMSMDLTPLLIGKPEFTWRDRLWVSLCFGLVILLVIYLIDIGERKMTMHFGDTSLASWLLGRFVSHGERKRMEKVFVLSDKRGLIVLAVFLQRRVFVVFGACGVFGYLGHLSYNVFKDSFLFPMALSLLGLALIYLGVQYQRHRQKFEEAVLALVPVSMRRLRPIMR